jgi:hypothetical protein
VMGRVQMIKAYTIWEIRKEESIREMGVDERKLLKLIV